MSVLLGWLLLFLNLDGVILEGLQLTLLSYKSTHEIPQISVRFPNGKMDKLVLNYYHKPENCRFIGRLSEETEACVAMTGCPGSSDKMEITILSENVVDTYMYKWYPNGTVIPIIVEDPFTVCVTFFSSDEITS